LRDIVAHKLSLRKDIVNNINKRYPQIQKILISLVFSEFLSEIRRNILFQNTIRIKNFLIFKVIKTKPKRVFRIKNLIRPSFLMPKIIFDDKFRKYSNEKIKEIKTESLRKHGTQF
jgi:nucleoid DNA-binding protein